MERLKRFLNRFTFIRIVAILLTFTLVSIAFFAERTGVQYTLRQHNLKMMPKEQIVTKEAAMASQEKTCLVLWDSRNPACKEAWDEFSVILSDMKVGHQILDISQLGSVAFSDYSTAVILLSDLSLMGEHILQLSDWVYHGGRALFPMTLEKNNYFSLIEAKLGISESSYDNTIVSNMFIDEDFMIGGGRAFDIVDPWDSALAVQLLDQENITVYAHTADKRELPLIWESRYGQGKFVVDNFGLHTKDTRGLFCASYSLLEDVCAYPVINGSCFYLDDFPSQVPSGANEYIMRDYGTSTRDFYVNIWWPDMMNFADQYGLRYTGLAIECYDDAVDGTTDAIPDKQTFLNFGNMLLRQGGEIGYHGYNHQPLCLDNCDYNGIYDYKTWDSYDAMKSGIDELMDFCEELFPDAPMAVYVPPSNLLSNEGRQFLLKEYPHITTISGIYFPDANLDFACTQEFTVSKEGVVDQPRVISGCHLDPFMELAAFSELNLHYINSHFTHPDDALDPDRGAEMGWEQLKFHFNDYLSWLYGSAPNLRNMTGTEMSAAVQRFAALTIDKERSDHGLTLTLGNFYDEAQIMVRFNEKTPASIEGGTLEQLTQTLYLVQATQPVVTITLE